MDTITRELIEQHLPLVEHIVLRMASGFPRHVDRTELTSAGILGLVEAATRYDEARGVPFSSFAGRRIRGAVLDLVRSADWAPRSVRAAARSTEISEQALASKLGRTPTTEELAPEVGMSPDELEQLRSRVDRGVVMALDKAYGEDAGVPLVATLTDPRAVDPVDAIQGTEQLAYLRDAVAHLPERHREVIVGYFLEGRTSEDIAESLGVTQSRVSQLRADALEMLKDGIEAQYQPATTEPPVGRVARRKSRYAAAIASSSTFASRLTVGDRWAVAEDAERAGAGRRLQAQA